VAQSAPGSSDGEPLRALEHDAATVGQLAHSGATSTAEPARPAATESAEPLTVGFAEGRSAFVMLPRTRPPERIPTLIAGLHGVCNPPEYACGYWVGAAADRGLLVCPTGNSRCNAASYHAPTWTEPETAMDADLEAAIAATAARFPALVAPPAERRGAVLFGFSKGAYAAVRIAQAHPGRWPYLVLAEADVALDPKALRAAGVLAVALLAGEFSPVHRGERRSAAALERAGFPARLWIMPRAGHYYSPDIDALMAEALDFVLGAHADAPAPTDRLQAR
jgi:hypothetical protein